MGILKYMRMPFFGHILFMYFVAGTTGLSEKLTDINICFNFYMDINKPF